MSEPTVFDDNGQVETVYLTRVPGQTTDDGWIVPSVDVGAWTPLEVGDRVVALDKLGADEFLVEVTAVDVRVFEVYYRLRHLADIEPGLYESWNLPPATSNP
jgi:hypothetical protein